MKRLLALVAVCSWAVCGLTSSTATAQSTSLEVTDHLTVPQWVNPETPGQLSGRVILPAADGSAEPIADATVVMTNSEGETVRSRTDDAGRFVMTGVEPGVYALSARAKGIFACYAMHVVSSDMAMVEMLPRQVEVAAAAIDYSIIKSSIIRYLPPYSSEQPRSFVGADLKSIAGRMTAKNLFQVVQTDGGLKGHIHVAGASGSSLDNAGLLNVFLVHKGEVIDRVVSSQNGTFQFDECAPGEYSILALGQTGLGMAGFELVEEQTANRISTNSVNSQTLVAALADLPVQVSGTFSLQIAPLPQAIESFDETEEDEEVVYGEEIIGDPILLDEFGNPIGGVGFGDPALGGNGALSGGGVGGGGFAGGGGGFGGGGGGGGFGGLGGLAGLAAIAAIASSDDNDPLPAPAPPASPTR
ncbi:carboxypeptidase-like regulatory domain-containing protein [Aporhodopirellula aestuarii]|uniref:Carboxypeptidase-like regulatory domain-containing protein n=1 Tax=Aporhodopirellula aestuarii TaxID=2950107 RepID=A0ABT0U808_9BACT|nr:carboxypeptidase-like regulatory domain-containing protein [Aporhodopirellula aestuarii]MCM2373050.1 carboxypeptidase-like regulatory domain-containing protein [Aporhodopirellula aestuarii]